MAEQSNATRWRTLRASVRGTSHVSTGTECHDSSAVREVVVDGQPVLVLVVSDGAGSQSHAKAGSATASAAAADAAVHQLLRRAGPLTEADMVALMTAAHRAVHAEAARLNVTPRSMSCTLLVAVLGPTWSGYAHIGDGAIVFREHDTFEPAFWPDNGQYADTTYFIGNADYLDRVRSQVRPTAAQDVALLTDGLQSLALLYANHTAHRPFFEPLFEGCAETEPDDPLQKELAKFLDSPAVNDRTVDDKTLVLASRIGS